jgi:hypothetical protein
MTTQAGLWIDHHKAFIVFIGTDAESTTLVESDLDKHPHFSGHELAEDGAADDQLDHRFAVHLDAYYDRVIGRLGNAASILILGPGEAKVELEKRLRHKGLADRIAGVETVDKMTHNQIAAKVREHFKQSFVPRQPAA